MAIWNCQGFLCKGVGITDDNAMFFASQGARQAWFSGKQAFAFSQYSVIREGAQSKNGYNVGCAHVATKLGATNECDYIMYQNTDLDDRWYYGRITDREYVNPNSTRVYFEIDFWETYQDLIAFGMSYVYRHHCEKNADWLGNYYAFTGVPTNTEPVDCTRGDFKIASSDIGNSATLSNSLMPSPSGYYFIASTNDGGDYQGLDYNSIGTATFDGAFGFIETGMSAPQLEVALGTYYQNLFNNLGSILTDGINLDISNLKNVYQVGCMPSSYSSNVSISPISKSDFDVPIYNGKTLSMLHMNKAIVALNGDRMDLLDPDFNGQPLSIKANVVCLQNPSGLISAVNAAGANKQLPLPAYPQYVIFSDGKQDWQNANGLTTAFNAIGGMVKIGAGICSVSFGQIAAGETDILAANGAVLNAMFTNGSKLGGTSQYNMWAAAAQTDSNAINVVINCPTSQEILAIDEYYTYNGYNMSRLMIPQPGLRDKVTFIQCSPALMGAASTFSGTQQFTDRMRAGLRFWNMSGVSHIGDEIGEN